MEEEIVKRLNRIENKLNNISSSSKIQLAKSVGISLIVAAAGLLSFNVWLSLGIFVGGFILYNYPSSKISQI